MLRPGFFVIVVVAAADKPGCLCPAGGAASPHSTILKCEDCCSTDADCSNYHGIGGPCQCAEPFCSMHTTPIGGNCTGHTYGGKACKPCPTGTALVGTCMPEGDSCGGPLNRMYRCYKDGFGTVCVPCDNDCVPSTTVPKNISACTKRDDCNGWCSRWPPTQQHDAQAPRAQP